MEILTNLRGNVIVIIIIDFFQLKANNEFILVNKCYGVTKDPNKNDYLLVFKYVPNGDLYNNLLNNFKRITWQDKTASLCDISEG